MRVIKLEHSGCIIEKAGQKIVCDPVEFLAQVPEIDNVVGIIITHQHSDHLQNMQIAKILEKNPQARIFTTSGTAPEVSHAKIVRNGDHIRVGDFDLNFLVGSMHQLSPV